MKFKYIIPLVAILLFEGALLVSFNLNRKNPDQNNTLNNAALGLIPQNTQTQQNNILNNAALGLAQNGTPNNVLNNAAMGLAQNGNTNNVFNNAALGLVQNTTPEFIDMSKSWEELFQSGGDRPAEVCKRPDFKLSYKLHKDTQEDQLAAFGVLPFTKENSHYNKPGFDQSAYMFDYLDNTTANIRENVVKKFYDMWSKIKAVPENPSLKDVYNPQILLGIYANNNNLPTGTTLTELAPLLRKNDPNNPTANQIQNVDEGMIYSVLKKYNPAFDPIIAKDSVKMTQIPGIFNLFKIPIIYETGYHKKLIDRFDYNGDGRLSAEEALFMIIWISHERLNTKELFEELSNGFFDPVFKYADCDKDGFLFAEGLFKSLQQMKMKADDQYNIFKCKNPKNRQNFWTSSVNDFILKNAQKFVGYMDLHEFRKGILLGYLDRQVKGNEIVNDDKFNMKDRRWDNQTIDKACPYKTLG
jgi:hypothetical protein